MVPLIHYYGTHVPGSILPAFNEVMLRVALTEIPVDPLAILYKLADEFYTDPFVKLSVATQLQNPGRDKQTNNTYADKHITPKQAIIRHPKTYHRDKAQDGPEEVDGLVHVMD